MTELCSTRGDAQAFGLFKLSEPSGYKTPEVLDQLRLQSARGIWPLTALFKLRRLRSINCVRLEDNKL